MNDEEFSGDNNLNSLQGQVKIKVKPVKKLRLKKNKLSK